MKNPMTSLLKRNLWNHLKIRYLLMKTYSTNRRKMILTFWPEQHNAFDCLRGKLLFSGNHKLSHCFFPGSDKNFDLKEF
jgi:hypothetical protein